MRYWRTSSSVERLRILPLASPTLRSDFSRSSRLDVLVARDVEAADRRALLHHDHQHARVLAAQLDVAEESGVVDARAAPRARAACPSVSPMLTGSRLNTVPSVMRCNPSTRMSVTVKSDGLATGAQQQRAN